MHGIASIGSSIAIATTKNNNSQQQKKNNDKQQSAQAIQQYIYIYLYM